MGRPQRVNVTGNRTVRNALYFVGLVTGNYDHCGWVNAQNVDQEGSDAESNCTTAFAEHDEGFAAGVNCVTGCNGTSDAHFSTHSGDVVECADVYPTPTEGEPQRCTEVVRTIPSQVVSAGYRVGWRYVTKGRKFVMVRDTNYHNLDGGWVFVSRSDFGKLCPEPQRLRPGRLAVMTTVGRSVVTTAGTVAVFAAVAVAVARGVPAASSSATSYRWVGSPIVVALDQSALPGFDVFFRLDHALSKDGAGLDASLDGVRAAEGVERFVQHNTVCGRITLSATRHSRLKRARPGSLVEVRIRVRATGQVLKTRVRVRRLVLDSSGNPPSSDKPYAKALGCR